MTQSFSGAVKIEAGQALDVVVIKPLSRCSRNRRPIKPEMATDEGDSDDGGSKQPGGSQIEAH